MEDGRKVEFNVLQLFERMNFSFFLLEKKVLIVFSLFGYISQLVTMAKL